MINMQKDIVSDTTNQMLLTFIKTTQTLASVGFVRLAVLHGKSEEGIGFGCKIEITSFLLMIEMSNSMNTHS